MKPSVAFVALQDQTVQKTKDKKPKRRRGEEAKKKFDRWRELNSKLENYWGQERYVPAKC